MINCFKTVIGRSEYEIVIEKSRFICYTAHVENEEEAKSFVKEIRKKNSLATHNCYAYICDNTSTKLKFSDDGEPSGTAGVPILEVIKSQGLAETAVVVTRYFGGIKLGAGGLVRAYSKCVAEGLKNSLIKEKQLCKEITVSMNYDVYPIVQTFCTQSGVTVTDSKFDADVKVKIIIPVGDVNNFIIKLNDYTSGKVISMMGEEKYM